MPNNIVKFLVPNIWATIPFVAGTVANHKIPKETPKAMAVIFDAGKSINTSIDIALKKYKPLKRIFLLYLSPKYPIKRVPNILKRPISDKIANAAQSSNPLS